MYHGFETPQSLAQAASGVERGEILFFESAAIMNGDREGVAHSKGGSRRSGRGKIERAGFFFDGDIEHYVAGASQSRARIRSHRHDLYADSPRRFDQLDHLLGLTA